jgi:hypothetical protein
MALVLIFLVSISTALFARGEDGDIPQKPMDKMTDNDGQAKEEGEEMFPHPFLVHMGISDMPGMLGVRATGYRQGFSDQPFQIDFAFHLEAGLFNRLGLHVRNDAIKNDPRTDVMLMYTVLRDKTGDSGISVFGAAEIPSGAIPAGEDKVIGAFGIGVRKTIPNLAVFDGNVHYMPQMKMAEYEISMVMKATTSLFPIIELGGEIRQGETTLYMLPALKFKLAPGRYVGVGTQIGLTSSRDFDTRVLLQLDMDW